MSPSTPTISASTTFLSLLKTRRTIYSLSPSSPIPDSQIQEIIEQALLHVPSSFNSQSTRIVLLLKGEHEKLWDITKEVLKGVVPAEQFEGTAAKIGGFRNGYGTVLFFEDRKVVAGMQSAYAAYADKFPGWATQSDAMTQYAIWVALEAEGLGANLQHYSPLIDAKVAAEWNIPSDWELNAQLVFGRPAAPAGEKAFMPLEERLKVYGA
ncbi:nitroreductase [Sclerotinia borealis F-4128]|uniref:Nitroreductase n=1 Tax=Sclerotinia borealis (strain F-4128) TaxID=1432307 RepID=W9CK90_SCLBF|nr:nitroreductase [Sclerotinia borealis F-4128]